MRLRGLDFRCGTRVAACLHTAAAIHGFDVEEPAGLHVLSPSGSRLRSTDGLKVHRREGAPLTIVDGRPITAPGWTAVEVARSQRRPRALPRWTPLYAAALSIGASCGVPVPSRLADAASSRFVT